MNRRFGTFSNVKTLSLRGLKLLKVLIMNIESTLSSKISQKCKQTKHEFK